MNKQERDKLKNEIAMKDVLTRRIGKWSKYSLLAACLFGAIAIWGFTGMHDSFLEVSDSARNILKWIGLIIAVPSGIFSLLSFLSYRNSKKHVLSLIDKLEEKDKLSVCLFYVYPLIIGYIIMKIEEES